MTGTAPPVTIIEGSSFLYIRHKNLYLVSVTRSNPNPALILEYLFQKLRILKVCMVVASVIYSAYSVYSEQ